MWSRAIHGFIRDNGTLYTNSFEFEESQLERLSEKLPGVTFFKD
jgi:hypothetical protein